MSADNTPGRRDYPPVDKQPGDWSIWPLADDKIRSESFGYEVITARMDLGQGARSTPATAGTGGFTHTRDEAETAVRSLLACHGFGDGREVYCDGCTRSEVGGDCPICPMLATDRDDALAEVDALRTAHGGLMLAVLRAVDLLRQGRIDEALHLLNDVSEVTRG